MPPKRVKKTISTPERELCGMVLGAQMAAKLIDTYKEIYPHLKVSMWGDSTIAMAQLHSKDSKKVFVTNRIQKIRTLIPQVPWRWIQSDQNASDLTSRGLSGSEFIESDLYWHGPQILAHPESYPDPYVHRDPGMTMVVGTTIGGAAKTVTVAAMQDTTKWSLFDIMPPKDFKSMSRYRNVLSNVFKFINLLKKKEMAPADIQRKTDLFIVKEEQKATLAKEWAYLKSNCGNRPPGVQPLHLYLDGHDIIRSGGRMHNADMLVNARFPMLLDKNSPLIEHRIMDAHISANHAGLELTKTRLRCNYWIPNITAKVKSTIKECVQCKKATGPPFRKPCAPPLSELRVSFRGYEVVGIDCCGHFWLKDARTGVKEKWWVLCITCANLRHLNFELIQDTSAESVLDALKIHSSYYGAPLVVLADNASYFKSTEAVLQHELGKKNIRFQYSPQAGPWYHSIYERMIGYLKTLLRRTLANTRRLLTPREFHILIKETSQIINNRPLTVASNDIKDALPLTPNKLLFGKDLFPLSQGRHDEDHNDPTYNPTEAEILKHWRKHDSILREFKDRFNQEYLSMLRQRHHYDHEPSPVVEADINVGDIVIMKGQEHRLNWQMAEVLQLLPGKDNQVRAVRLRTPNGETNRPICLLYPLLKRDQENEIPQQQPDQDEQVQEAAEVQEGNHDGGDGEQPSQVQQGRPKRAAAQEAELRIQAQQQFL